tara:strand:- start:122 stop:742 length:621 start_codon:yes stop_codon:yes gene_type:complete
MSKYKEPNISITKVYTKTGDKGKTSLIGGESVSKHDSRVEAYGDIEELNVLIGLVVNNLKKHSKIASFANLIKRLVSIQNELFNLGTMLASIGSSGLENMPKIDSNDIEIIEQDIDRLNQNLEALKSFTLPGGDETVLSIHLSRVVCRRVERRVSRLLEETSQCIDALKYLNRLSDYLFVLGRHVSKELDLEEQLWSPNQISSNQD